MLGNLCGVAIENIHRHMATGKPLEPAILDGAQEIALPAFVSTLCICIVFVPMFFLSGVARYLFVPLAEAVVFAMLASYVLSRTLGPTLVMWFYRNADHYGESNETATGLLRPFAAIHRGFEQGFAQFRGSYRHALAGLLERPRAFAAILLTFCVGSLTLIPQLGQDFFPAVDAGQLRLHLRARSGTRIEETAKLVVGMLPMSLGLGEGGEQNAPLGRAVIGGLVVATVATLFFVPVVFRLMHRRPAAKVADTPVVSPVEACSFVITARKTDVGELVSATAGKELFRLAQSGSLRVFVRVPQTSSRAVTVGQSVELTLPELPGRIFPAKVVRTAGALDPVSRTLLTELEADNAKGEILAGSYAQVRFPQCQG